MEVISEAIRIKARLMDCIDQAQVEQVANEERETVVSMSSHCSDGKTMAIHISNLKAWKLSDLAGLHKRGKSA